MRTWKFLVRYCIATIVIIAYTVTDSNATITFNPPTSDFKIRCIGGGGDMSQIETKIKNYIDFYASTSCNDTIVWSHDLLPEDIVSPECDVFTIANVTLTDCDETIIAEFKFTIEDFERPQCVNCHLNITEECSTVSLQSRIDAWINSVVDPINYIDNCTSPEDLIISHNYDGGGFSTEYCTNAGIVDLGVIVTDKCSQSSYFTFQYEITDNSIEQGWLIGEWSDTPPDTISYYCDKWLPQRVDDYFYLIWFGQAMQDCQTFTDLDIRPSPGELRQQGYEWFKQYRFEVRRTDGCNFSDPWIVILNALGPEVSFTDFSSNQDENIGIGTACVSIVNRFGTTTVWIKADPSSSAIAGEDYSIALDSFELTFLNGNQSEQCFDYTIIDDDIIEDQDTILFAITNVFGDSEGRATGITNHQVVIIDNDDLDNDEIALNFDNCPDHFNPNQADFDSDGIGNACDDSHTLSHLLESEQNIYLSNDNSGVILKSKNGTCWMWIVNDEGQFSSIKVDCP